MARPSEREFSFCRVRKCLRHKASVKQFDAFSLDPGARLVAALLILSPPQMLGFSGSALW
jgi:hypothetical protein